MGNEEREAFCRAVAGWKAVLKIEEVDLKNYSPLTLAYIGDCVYELAIRTILVSKGNASVDMINRVASHYAKAVTQSQVIEEIQDKLTEAEQEAYRRGRNAKSPTKAKNASVLEYRKATGFEAVIGYLYLTEQFERLVEVLEIALDHAGINKSLR